MVSRGRKNYHRHRDEENTEEVESQNSPTAEDAARFQEAERLAHRALRMATEAREAARRLREYRSTISMPYRQGNMIDVDDTPTSREGDDNCRC